jgi:hypothetical protein
MRCPKCGNRAGDVPVCPRCEYVLDPTFLEMLDDDDDDDDDDDVAEVPAYAAASEGSGEGDPVILGDGGGDFDEFLSDQTGSFQLKEGGGMIVPAPINISSDKQAWLKSHAVLKVSDGVDVASLGLSPFEQHVIGFINGCRPVARLRKKTELSSDDLRIALAMIVDRGVLELRGFLKKPPGGEELARDPTPAKRDVLESDDSIPEDLRALFALDEDDDDDLSPFAEMSFPPTVVDELLEPAPAPSATPASRAPPPIPGAAPPPIPGGGTPAAAKPKQRPQPAPKPSPAPAPQAGAANPKHAKAAQLYEAAMQDLQDGKHSRAKAYAEMALGEHPDSPRYQELLANWGSVISKSREAIKPEVKALIDEARGLEKAEDFDEALRVLKRAARQHPGAATVFNRLGVLQLTRLKDKDGAKASLVRACELAPDNPVYRHNLGKVLGKH